MLLRKVGRGQQGEVDALEHCEVINDQQQLKNGKLLIKNMKITFCSVDSLEQSAEEALVAASPEVRNYFVVIWGC